MFFWTCELEPGAGRHGVRFAVTSRTGGASIGPWSGLNLGGGSGDDPEAVESNRRDLAKAFGVSRDHLILMRQCHSADVTTVDGPWGAEPPALDAVVTTRDDLALAALSADCVPVLLADPVAGVVGAVHAGRPGMVAGVALRAVERMVDEGAGVDDLVAVVGPSVCGRCYEVPASMRDVAADVSPVSATLSWTGTPAIDVAAGVVDQLTGLGVDVTWVPGCTREDANLYSYRRDGTTGRFAGVVRLLPS